MQPSDLKHWQGVFSKKVSENESFDPAHDLLHLQRVAKMALHLQEQEGGKIEVIFPAAWLHDFVVVPKQSPLRSSASRLSAEGAIEYLRSEKYPEEFFDEIYHCIEAHSFSAKIEGRTLEAKIVQDADRLDSLGCIGIARCFVTAGLMRRALYSPEDAFCSQRPPNDQLFTLDHFYEKLLRLGDSLQTHSARLEGARRTNQMRSYLEGLREELGIDNLISRSDLWRGYD